MRIVFYPRTQETTDVLFKKVPAMEAVGRIVVSELLADNQVLFDNFRKLSPEQRFIELLEKRPDLCNRVPQYMIASYLGIQPESLSRIFRRIMGNKV